MIGRHYAVRLYAIVLLLSFTLPGFCVANPAEPAAEPAFQGHSAEMLMRSEEGERRHRALFFDEVDVELGKPGLSCDHLVTSRPHHVAGPAYVVVLTAHLTATTKRVRVWLPPGQVALLADAFAKASALAAGHLPEARFERLDAKRFALCR